MVPHRNEAVEQGAGAASDWRVAWLRLRVHADAFRYDPGGYLKAVLWRMRGLRLRSRNRIASLAGRSPHAYDLWIARDEPRIRAAQPKLETPWAPRIVPVIDCRGSTDGLEDTLASLGTARWVDECVLLGAPASLGPRVVGELRDLSPLVDPEGTWLCVLKAGDRLASGALAIYAAAASEAGKSSVIYADDDLIGLPGSRRDPLFKPQWNPELFEHHDFVSGSAIVRATPETIAELPPSAGLQTFVAQAATSGAEPIHLPLVLHHRRTRPKATIPAKAVKLDAGTTPSVTIIIPTRNQLKFLRTCVEGVAGTDYPAIETIVIDNGSDDAETIAYLDRLAAEGTTVLPMPGPFNFSVLNNAAVCLASGEMLCFLNNDVEMIEPDWLDQLVQQAVRPDVGAVGARLLYPDGTVQHAGVCTGIGGGAGHAHRFQDADATGYFDRARLPQRVTAVTAACLVVAKDKFLAVGGFDEKNFPVAFNDVDLCLKLNAAGWQSLYEPRATLIHHESKSRGSDAAKSNRVRFAGELAALKRKWGTDTRCDPYHHPHLSPFCEQFLIAV